jgi:AcrR family transcriptional regulator
LRRDARDNRERILAAAHLAFSTIGLDAPLESIAAAAGVGKGTLYRHFPDREALINSIYKDFAAEVFESVDEALRATDTWAAFRAYMITVVELQARDRGLADIILTRHPSASTLQSVARQTLPLTERLLSHAKRRRVVRADLEVSDIMAVYWGAQRVLMATRDIAPNAWRRYLAMQFAAFRAPARGRLPKPALTRSQLWRAMVSVKAVSVSALSGRTRPPKARALRARARAAIGPVAKRSRRSSR